MFHILDRKGIQWNLPEPPPNQNPDWFLRQSNLSLTSRVVAYDIKGGYIVFSYKGCTFYIELYQLKVDVGMLKTVKNY